MSQTGQHSSDNKNSINDSRAIANLVSSGNGISLPAVNPKAFVFSNKFPVQLLASHARQVVTDFGLSLPVNKESIAGFVADTGNDHNHRLHLLKAWNKGQPPLNKIPLPPDLMPSPALASAAGADGKEGERRTGKRVTRSDSFEDFGGKEMAYDLEGHPAEKLGKKGTESTQDVPILKNVPDAIRMVRAFGAKSAETKFVGPQFILQLGPHSGLFDSPRGNDLVYVPLSSSGAGPMMREGGIFDWSSHARALAENFSDMEPVKAAILATINGESIPVSGLIMSTVGAMICDAKKSITGFLAFLDEFTRSTETSAAKLFSSNPKDAPVWMPSVVGGRSKVVDKRAEVMVLDYQPSAGQMTALAAGGLAIQWIIPDGRCVFGSLAYLRGMSTPAVIETVLAALRAETFSAALTTVLSFYAETGVVKDAIIECIQRNDWSNPTIADAILPVSATALGLGLRVLMPDAQLRSINGGGPAVIVKVTSPLEHYHATKPA